MIHALQLLCTLSSIWLKKKSIKKSVRCPKRCQQHQDWTAAWTLLKHLSDAVSQPLNKRIQDKPTYTKTFWGDVLSSASVNLSLRRLRNIIIAAMSQLRLENCTSTKFKATWGDKKKKSLLVSPFWNISSAYWSPDPPHWVKHVRHHRNTWLSVWTQRGGAALFINYPPRTINFWRGGKERGRRQEAKVMIGNAINSNELSMTIIIQAIWHGTMKTQPLTPTDLILPSLTSSFLYC